MAKQRPSLNQADINLLKKTFATKNDLKPLKSDVREIKDDLKNFATKDGLDTKLKPIKKDIKKIKKDINTIVSFFDSEYLELKARVERIENYLKISPLTS